MRRITTAAAVGVLALAATGCWPMPGANPNRTGENPFETAITPSTVGDLAELWSTPLVGAQSPVMSPVGLHVATTDCDLVTLAGANGAELWRANVGLATETCTASSPWGSRRVSAVVTDETVAAGVFRSWGGPRLGIHAQSALSVFDIHTGALLAGPHPGQPETRRGQRLLAIDSIVVPFTGTLGYVPRLHLFDLAGTPQRTMVTGAQGQPTILGDLAYSQAAATCCPDQAR